MVHLLVSRMCSNHAKSLVIKKQPAYLCIKRFSSPFQPPNSVRVSLWLQWTLPRVVANLYSRSAVSSSAVCVSAELEDLTASVDYIDTMLQMQYKIGAFNVSHFTHR